MELMIGNYDYLQQVCIPRPESVWQQLSAIFPTSAPECINGYPVGSAIGLLIVFLLIVLFSFVKYFPEFSASTLGLKVTVAIREFQPEDFWVQFFNTPSWLSFGIISGGSVAVFLIINGFFVLHAGKCPPEYIQNNSAAVIAAATAILFPFIILLLGRESQISSSGLSTPEVLLKFCWVFPIGVALLTLLGIVSFPFHTDNEKIFSFVAVIFSAFTFVRLLQVTLNEGTRLVAERQLVRQKVFLEIAQTASYRMAANATNQAISDVADSGVSIKKYIFDRKGKKTTSVLSQRTGEIIEIITPKLKQASDLLNQAGVQTNAGEKNENEPEGEQNLNVNSSYEIQVVGSVGEYVTQGKSVLARLFRPEAVSESGKLAEAKELVLRAFVIRNSESIEKDTGFSRLISDLRQFAKTAIETGNTGNLDGVSRTFKEIHSALIMSFRKINAKFSPEMVKNEIGFFNDSWKPLEELFKSLRELTLITFQDKEISHEVKKIVELVPFKLCMQAYEQEELLSFSRFLSLSQFQSFVEFRNHGIATNGPLEWLKSLLRYRILVDLEESKRDPELFANKKLLDFARPVFREVQLHAKLAIDFNSIAYFRTVRTTLVESVKERASEIDWDYEADEHLSKSEIFKWIHEILVGLGTYALLSKEGQARAESKEANKETSEFLADIVSQFNLSFVTLLEFYHSIQRGQRDEYWGWDWWESIPEHHAKAMVTESYVKRFFFILLIRSYIRRKPDENEIKNLEFVKFDIFSWKFTDVQFEQEFLRASQDCAFAGIGDDLATYKEGISATFKKINKNADIRSELSLVSKDISEKILQEISDKVLKTFPRSAKARTIFPHHELHTDLEQNDHLKWGINTLLPREYLVDDSDIHSSDIGNQYGNDLASGESEYVLSCIDKKVDEYPTAEWQLGNAIDHLKSVGVSVENILIVAPSLPHWFLRDAPEIEFRRSYTKDKIEGPDATVVYNGEVFNTYLIFMRGDFDRECFYVLDSNSVSLGWAKTGIGRAVGDTHFFLDVKDPLKDQELAESIRERESDWLMEYEENIRDRMIGKYVWFRLLEGIDAQVLDHTRIFRLSMKNPNRSIQAQA